MSTVTATAPGTFDQETHHKKNTWAKVLPIIGIVLIVIYCLAPFYWMLVSSLRPDSEIFDNTWWPAHPSMENYQAVFQPSNNFFGIYFLIFNAILKINMHPGRSIEITLCCHHLLLPD